MKFAIKARPFFLLFLILPFSLLAEPNDNSSNLLFFEKAKEFLKKGEVNLAKEEFKKDIKINPLHFESFYQLGYIYFLEGKYKKAIEYLKKCLQIKPDYGKAYLKVGCVYYDLNQDIKAKEYFEKAKEFLQKEKDKQNLKIVEEYLRNLSCKSVHMGFPSR